MIINKFVNSTLSLSLYLPPSFSALSSIALSAYLGNSLPHNLPYYRYIQFLISSSNFMNISSPGKTLSSASSSMFSLTDFHFSYSLSLILNCTHPDYRSRTKRWVNDLRETHSAQNLWIDFWYPKIKPITDFTRLDLCCREMVYFG